MAARTLRRGVTSLAHQASLSSSLPFSAHRMTKIICTIGPASFPLLPEMLLAGMNVARINCAHGSKAGYADIVRGVRAAEASLRASGAGSPSRGRPLCGSRSDAVAIAFDIKGPEIRVGRFGPAVPPTVVVSQRPDGSTVRSEGQKEVALRVGDRLTLTTDPVRAEAGSATEMFVSYRALPARALRDRIGWVGQEAALFQDTIEYNIAYGRAGGAAVDAQEVECGDELVGHAALDVDDLRRGMRICSIFHFS